MPNKEPEFTVTDRRKFTTEGERRAEAVETENHTPEAPGAQPPSPPAQASGEEHNTPDAQPFASPDQPPAPSAEEQQAQHDAYRESTGMLDSQLRQELGGQRPQDFEMTFERLIASLYMTALMQLGLDQQGEQRRVDIMGARQTIDTIALLQDKTKGNLTPAEENLVRNVLYELRMAYVETMNAIARSAQAGPEPGKK